MLTVILSSAAGVSLGMSMGMAYTLYRWRQWTKRYTGLLDEEMHNHHQQLMTEVRRRVRAEQHIRVLLSVNDIQN